MSKSEVAIFGGGCFWCTEAIFSRLRGVTKVVSGYAGGKRAQPTYEQVSTGTTGHAEVVQITYDPQIISYKQLLEIFWATHDPTSVNKQGADVGTQYRSIIFTTTAKQQTEAEQSLLALQNKRKTGSPIVTEILPLEMFYTAESYHQKYYDRQPNAPYCSFVIGPKLRKLEEQFAQLLK